MKKKKKKKKKRKKKKEEEARIKMEIIKDMNKDTITSIFLTFKSHVHMNTIPIIVLT